MPGRYPKNATSKTNLVLSAHRKKNKGENLKRWRLRIKEESAKLPVVSSLPGSQSQPKNLEDKSGSNRSSRVNPSESSSANHDQQCRSVGSNDAARTSTMVSHSDKPQIVQSLNRSPEIANGLQEKDLPCFHKEGRRIVGIYDLFDSIREISDHSPFDCNFQHMKCIKEDREGLFSRFTFKCQMCMTERIVASEVKSKSHPDVNLAMVSGALGIGCGYSQMQELTGAMNIPFMSTRKFSTSEETVGDMWSETAEKEMQRAVEEEIDIAKKEGRIDKDGVPMITVVVDGAWSKRSYRTNYNALSGVAAIVGYNTRKVLFMGVRNKFCSVCNYFRKRTTPIPKHACSKNWVGSSQSMEADIILEGFCSSIGTHGVKYSFFIGDGDSSVYRRLQEVMPYAPSKITKIECRNHILRNYSNYIKNYICQAIGKSKIGSPEEREHVKRNSLRLRTAISAAIKYRVKEDTALEKKIADLKKDFLNSPFHVFGEHKDCELYFCKGAKEGEKNWISTFEQSGILAALIEGVSRLAKHAKSLVHNVDSNMVEHFNALIAKHVGGKRINYALKGSYERRCTGAVIRFNRGKLHHPVFESCYSNSPGKYTKLLEEKRRLMVKKASVKRVLLRETSKSKKSRHSDATGHHDYGDVIPAIEEEDAEILKMSLKLGQDEIASLENRTRKQSNDCEEWMKERKKRLTASNFGRICRMRRTTDKGRLLCK